MENTILGGLLLAIRQQNAAFTDPAPKEPEQDFYKRLVEGVGTISEEIWNTLTENEQLWYNQAAKAINGMEVISPCPGFAEAFPNNIMVAQEHGGVAGVKNSAAGQRSSSTKEPQKGKGVMHRARQIALANPEFTWAQVDAAVKAEGFETKGDTTWNCFQEIKNVRKAADELGITISPPTKNPTTKHIPPPPPAENDVPQTGSSADAQAATA